MASIPRPKKKQEGERLETEHSGDSEDNDKTRELNQYMARMREKIDDEIAKNRLERQKRAQKYWGIQVTLRWQELNAKLFCSGTRSAAPCLDLQIAVSFSLI